MKSEVVFAFLFCISGVFSIRGYNLPREIKPRIINGQIAIENQFPYQACLLLDDGKNRYVCGGSLISKEWILTAATCTKDAKSGTVYLGTNIRGESKIKYDVTQKSIINHSQYVRATSANNIALIKITAVPFSKSIKPIALPKRGATIHFNSIATVSGWGRTQDDIPSYSTDLRYTDLEIIPNKQCVESYNKQIVNNGTLCTDHQKGNGICIGDYGGPLALKSSPPVLVGIAAFYKVEGCELNVPNGFTRITYYLNWIQENTRLKL